MTEYKKIIEDIKPEMDKVINFFSEEIKRVRTDRATPSLVEDIVVNCFDQKMPLKQLAAISCPEKRQILIQPWDKSYTKDILEGVQKSESELSPMVEDGVIRITLPPLTEEYRGNLLKILSGKKEDARIVLKKNREDAWRRIQDKFQEGEVTEDEKFKAKEDLQKLIDDYNEKLEQLAQRKQGEIKS